MRKTCRPKHRAHRRPPLPLIDDCCCCTHRLLSCCCLCASTHACAQNRAARTWQRVGFMHESAHNDARRCSSRCCKASGWHKAQKHTGPAPSHPTRMRCQAANCVPPTQNRMVKTGMHLQVCDGRTRGGSHHGTRLCWDTRRRPAETDPKKPGGLPFAATRTCSCQAQQQHKHME